jgi:hypothetical protein
VKGRLEPGALADFAVLSADYFAVPEREIHAIEALLTVVGGRIVHGADVFATLAPPLPPASPDWSPVHLAPRRARVVAPDEALHGAIAHTRGVGCAHARPGTDGRSAVRRGLDLLWGPGGCGCFAY